MDAFWTMLTLTIGALFASLDCMNTEERAIFGSELDLDDAGIDCVHWQKPADIDDNTVAVCRLAGDAAKSAPLAPLPLNQIPGHDPNLALVTRADHGCNAGLSHYADENEDVWKEKIPRIKRAVAERTPHYSERVDNLASLLSYLQDYHDAVLASIEGYDPEDQDAPDIESTIGDSTMEEFISLIRSLPTIPAVIPQRIRETGKSQ